MRQVQRRRRLLAVRLPQGQERGFQDPAGRVGGAGQGHPARRRQGYARAFLDAWLGSANDTVSYRTWLNQEGIVWLHLKPAIGDKWLTRLSPRDVQLLQSHQLKAGLSSGRV